MGSTIETSLRQKVSFYHFKPLGEMFNRLTPRKGVYKTAIWSICVRPLCEVHISAYTFLHHLSSREKHLLCRPDLHHASLLITTNIKCGTDMQFGNHRTYSRGNVWSFQVYQFAHDIPKPFKGGMVGSQPLFSHLGVYFTCLTYLVQSKQENSIIISYTLDIQSPSQEAFGPPKHT